MAAAIANAMAQRGHHITFLNERPVPCYIYPLYKMWYRLQELSSEKMQFLPRGTHSLGENYSLDPSITQIFYNFTDNNLKVQALRSKLKSMDFDVCLPFFGDARSLVWAVTLLGSNIPFLYTERCAPAAIEQEFWSRAGRLAAMSGADRIHLLDQLYCEGLPSFLSERVRIIPNPAPSIRGRANPRGRAGERKRVLWLGRLHDCIKRCNLAISAFARLKDRFPDWDLHIVGTGSDLYRLQAMSKKLGLDNRCFFEGETANPLRHYMISQIFCITSRTEGFPNTLLEAMACGLPSVGINDCAGTKILLHHEQNGLLAEEATPLSLAKSLADLMANEEKRVALGHRAADVQTIYNEDTIMNAWESLFQETAACRGNTVMDSFASEPFASMARLSACARREWLYRDFGAPMPGNTPECWLYNTRYRLKKYLKRFSKGVQ